MFKLKVTVITLFPEIFDSLNYGLMGQAIEKGLVSLDCINLRDFGEGKHQKVDDSPFGGGDGMILKAEPLYLALQSALKQMPQAKIIYMSPQGDKLTQDYAFEWSKAASESETDLEFILICGRYGGVDSRIVEKYVDFELSVGDYILNGGEFAALIFMDTLGRLVPGFLGNSLSKTEDSFSQGMDYREAPQYTRPQEWRGMKVPSVLLSGDHQLIAEWKRDYFSISDLNFKKRPGFKKTKE